MPSDSLTSVKRQYSMSILPSYVREGGLLQGFAGCSMRNDDLPRRGLDEGSRMNQEWQYLHWKTSYFRGLHIYIAHRYSRGTGWLAIASRSVLLLLIGNTASPLLQ
jgi:hypothetical protein